MKSEGQLERDRWDVNAMNIDGDIIHGGCNGEVLNDGVIGEKEVRGEVDEDDGVMTPPPVSPGRSLRTAVHVGM